MNHFCEELLGDVAVWMKQPFSVTNKMCISTIAWVETSGKCSQHRPVPLTLSRDRAAWPGRGGWVQGPGEMPWSLVTMRCAARPAPSHGHRQVQGECEHPPKILVPKETRLLSPTRVRLHPPPRNWALCLCFHEGLTTQLRLPVCFTVEQTAQGQPGTSLPQQAYVTLNPSASQLSCWAQILGAAARC